MTRIKTRLLLLWSCVVMAVSPPTPAIQVETRIYQGESSGEHICILYMTITNTSENAYPFGVWEVLGRDDFNDCGVVDLRYMFRDVLPVILERHPDFGTEAEVWQFMDEGTKVDSGEVSFNWEVDVHEDGLLWISNPAAGLHLSLPGFDYDQWFNTQADADKDTLTFYIRLDGLLDFNQNGRLDPDEFLRESGEWGGDRNLLGFGQYSVGLGLFAGLLSDYADVPVFTLGPVTPPLHLQSGVEEASLQFTCTSSPRSPTWFKWMYLLSTSTSLSGEWTPVEWYPDNGETIVYPISSFGAQTFYRLEQYNERHFIPNRLSPNQQAPNVTLDALAATLSWEDAGEAAEYRVYLAENQNVTDGDLLDTTDAKSIHISNLTYDSVYT